MNSHITKLLVIGAFSFCIASCSSQKNASSSQERPQGGPNQRQGGGGPQGGQGGPSGQGGQRPSFSDLVSNMDSNNDGKLSKSEIQGPLKNDFSKVDSNEDGYITEEEFNNAPAPQGR